jgi:hypothetical protein
MQLVGIKKLIVILFSLKFNIIFYFDKILFLTYIQDPDPHSFSKMDPDPHSPEKLDPDPHKINADPKHCGKQRKKKSRSMFS